jgi:hypothetical protein
MTTRNGSSRAPMNHDAYAGFLKLLLTPTGTLPDGNSDVDAYIRHANRVDPLSPATRRVIGHPTGRAA